LSFFCLSEQNTVKNIKPTNKLSLLILDTAGKERHNYRNLLIMARMVGFTPDYKNLYDFLENPQIQSYDAVFSCRAFWSC
jgi:hypothetical protein